MPCHPALSACDRLIDPPPCPSPAGDDPARCDARAWGALVLLCGVLFLDGLDVSMVGVALPSIRADLGLTPSQLQWIVSGYVLGYGGLLLLGGRAADLLGRRRTLLAAATGRCRSARPAARAGFSLGLVLGGVLTEVGWRVTFLLPVPIAAAILFALPRMIADDTPARTRRRSFDFAGAVTVTVSAGTLLLVHTVVQAPNAGWGAPQTLLAFLAAAVLLAAFVAIELRTSESLVRLGVLRSGTLARANVTAVVVFGCYVSFQFVATLYLQALLGWSPIGTALAFLPGGFIVALPSRRVGPLADRYGTERVIAVGLIAFVAGYALMLRIG